ncbi:TetR/AcrR family transcriptional regulator [Couchioplanes caeruleus]|uniref:TetR family transcriptional regulator n=2 Tax=Couchioplanes caeruleus TaxID=56438 RepID=A0A1K0FFK9_9ACTN|nr:TetR/AcrR family transcriptional regulator [Couchioplanes caeruleus]OJF11605.1 TetR family transcriptional regulator [Couchioplanes caeruleus subsp. caeruleus]ROP32899.1 TetR family transcriptional regulator [Couchioplanes caeruleus]
MTSTRNSPSARNNAEDALLDAARECVLAVGLRRTTLTDVARRAGVSRMTMYRRWPDMATLMADLMTREWTALVIDAEAEAEGDTARERIVDGLVRGARALRRHAMFRRVVELDPEVLVPYLVDRRGGVQDAILDHLVSWIKGGEADGSLRRQDPVLLARSAILAMHGFVISAGTMLEPAGLDGEVTEDGLDDELRLLLDRFFRP